MEVNIYVLITIVLSISIICSTFIICTKIECNRDKKISILEHQVDEFRKSIIK